MSINEGIIRHKRYKTDANGNHTLVSEWTSATTVEMEDGKTLPEALEEVTGVVDITQADYDNLSEEEKNNGQIYNIIDAPDELPLDAFDVAYKETTVGDALENVSTGKRFESKAEYEAFKETDGFDPDGDYYYPIEGEGTELTSEIINRPNGTSVEKSLSDIETEQENQNVHLTTLDEEQAEQNGRLDGIDSEVAQSEVDRKGLELFGWIAPKLSDDCYDYIEDGVYHKKVGRVDLGNLIWDISGSGKFFYVLFPNAKKMPNRDTVFNGVSEMYSADTYNNVASGMNKTIAMSDGGVLAVCNTDYSTASNFQSAMSGVYLYYELATEQTVSIYNPNVLDTIGTTTNLFNPTVSSQVVSGTSVTITNNGNGTITVTGSSTTDKVVSLGTVSFEKGTYKLVGTPSGANGYYLDAIVGSTDNRDLGNGVIFNGNTASVVLFIKANVTVSNLVLKPMITTNLQADYSQFVPYTGSTGKLNSDVAEIKSKIMCGSFTFTPTMTQFSDNKLYTDRRDKSITIQGITQNSVVHVMVQSEHSAWVGRVATAKDTITRMNLYATENITSQMTFKYIAINQ